MAYYRFEDPENPTCYNLAKLLERDGYLRAADHIPCPQQIHFSDRNLILNPEVTCWLEEKHRLASLLYDYQGTLIPETYIINDHNFSQALEHLTNTYYYGDDGLQETIPDRAWILKPALQNNGDNIHLFNNITKMWDHYSLGAQRLGGPHILQRYINNPLLLDGKKHSLRLYLIITNHCGAYVYHHGYINQSFTDFTMDNFAELSAHITNEHLGGTLCNVQQIPTFNYPYYEQIKQPAWKIIRQVLQLLDQDFAGWRHQQKPASPAFAIFGFDFLIDRELRPWLLEINHGPHFPTRKPHALHEPLLQFFWQDIINAFVLPIVTHQTKTRPLLARSNN